MTNPWKSLVVAVALGTFVGVAGAFADPMDAGEGGAHHNWTRQTPAQRLERFSQKLKLTPDQRSQVSAIFDASRAKMEALRAEFRPKFEAIRADTQTQIRALLTPDQQKTFDTMQAERAARRKSRSPRR